MAAVLFALVEFRPEWGGQIYAQTTLVLLALLSAAPEATATVVRWPAMGSALVVGIAAWRTHSLAWLLLAAVLFATGWFRFARVRARALWFFTATAMATLGLGCAYLHWPVIWEWPRLRAAAGFLVGRIGAVIPSAPGLTPEGVMVIHGRPFHLSAFSVLTAAPMVSAVLAWHRPSRRRFLVNAGLSLLFAVVSRFGLVLALGSTGHPTWLLDPIFSGLFVTLTGFVTTLLCSQGPPRAELQNRRSAVVFPVVFSVVAGMALWGAIGPEQPRPPRPLRIVIDDAHGEWETTQRSFDISHYGRDTVYTYALLRDWLSSRHFVEADVTAPIRPRGDVLLIKTPAVPYSEEEIGSIETFVRGGGGLLVLGDHTNLFGTTQHINDVLAPVDMRLRSDAALPITGVTRIFRASWWNAGPLFPLGVPFEFQTSATIVAGSPWAHPLAVDTEIVAEAAEYSNERNFGDLRPSPEDRFPPLAAAAWAPWGRGRVVLLADSTPWSNFSFFAPPNKEVLDAALRFAAVPPASLLAFLLLSVSGICLIAALSTGSSAAPCIGAAFASYGLLCALIPAGAAGFQTTPLRSDAPPPRRLFIDSQLGPVNWNSDIRTGAPADRDVYTTFLAWISRLGFQPEIRTQDVYSDPKVPVLVINPTRRVDAGAAAMAEAYVRSGGRLLVLDDPDQRPASTAESLLEIFDIQYHPEVVDAKIHAAEGPPLPELVWALPLSLLQETRGQPGRVLASSAGLCMSLRGVDPVLVDEKGVVIYGRKKIGQGSVRVFARSSVFSQMVMGDVWGGVEPGQAKEQIYALEYSLLEELFGGDPTASTGERKQGEE